jgi:hypothetical protein
VSFGREFPTGNYQRPQELLDALLGMKTDCIKVGRLRGCKFALRSAEISVCFVHPLF